MTTSLSSVVSVASRTFLIAAVALSSAGCVSSVEDDSGEVAEGALVSARERGIDVFARYRLDFDQQPPTIGTQQTTPVLTLEIIVDDAAVRERHPGFDGFERVFALVPRADVEGVRYERVEIPFWSRSVRGHITLRNVDIHRAETLRLAPGEGPTLSEHGIAFGLDTNVGTIWAQGRGKNFVPTAD